MRIVTLIATLAALEATPRAYSAPMPAAAPVPEFTLRDQFDRPFGLRDHGDSVVVLICSDREGSQWTSAWSRAAYAAADSSRRATGSSRVRVSIRFAADLRGVPGFLHGFVKGKFKPAGRPANPVLLDWDGVIARTLGLTPHVANVFVLDASLKPAYVAAGQGRPDELGAFRAALRRTLEAPVAGRP